jgi:hypothetical protein
MIKKSRIFNPIYIRLLLTGLQMQLHPPLITATFFVGLGALILLDGECRCYTNLDNAASTPSESRPTSRGRLWFNTATFMRYRIQRLSTHAYEEARNVMKFIGRIQTSHLTVRRQTINKLPDAPFMGGEHRHHQWDGAPLNDLLEHHTGHPYSLTPDRKLDEEDFDLKLNTYGERTAWWHSPGK